jgi:hypothetical protein
LEGNIYTIKKKTEALTGASKEVGLEVNTEETMYILMSCHQNAGQNHNIKTAKVDPLKIWQSSNMWDIKI